MAALIPDERCFVLACFIIFLSYKNGKGHIWDQCCHLQGDGASLGTLPKLTTLFLDLDYWNPCFHPSLVFTYKQTKHYYFTIKYLSKIKLTGIANLFKMLFLYSSSLSIQDSNCSPSLNFMCHHHCQKIELSLIIKSIVKLYIQ